MVCDKNRACDTRGSPVPQVTRLSATQNEGGCDQVPRLPRETKVDVTKCHACHAKCHGVTGDQNRPKRATRGSPVPQVTRLPRKTKVDVTKCHACHAKRRWMSPSAAASPPATKTGPSAPPEPAQCHKCHACHAKRRWMWPSATPATRNEGGCHQVPRLPRKVPRRHGRPKPAQARHQSQPNATSATPATQNEGIRRQVPHQVENERWCVKDGVWKMVVEKDDGVCKREMVCERWWLTKMCVRDGVWERVCERWCVKDDGWQGWCVKDVCEEEAAGGGGEAGKNPDTESKTRTPHKDVGEKKKEQHIF